ncbi:hypothetical protein BAE44_0014677 [Dichanthelium oligosanthes]|uniref:Alpha/beta hydrolase fold-3 domain-containing protein n=1 Tax=Dichanthelium oligosanthes TaxID=888268 RepID=A0A1E5VGP3_9POAL|nr:hypothetical protein BAE44_0014677 [Dichanthelium oligosanthes]
MGSSGQRHLAHLQEPLAPSSATAGLFLACFPSATGHLGLPVIFSHGGGFVYLSAMSPAYDATCRCTARYASAAVLSVDYRRAPEHRFPAPYDDGLAALRFLDDPKNHPVPTRPRWRWALSGAGGGGGGTVGRGYPPPGTAYPPPGQQAYGAPPPQAYVAPPPAYPPTQDAGAYGQQQQTTSRGGDGFWKGCCAAICCCCVLDMCF